MSKTGKAAKGAALVFSEDFNTLDWSKYLSRWWYTDHNANGCSLASNGELQLYVNHEGPLTAAPWTVTDSILHLTASTVSPPVDGYSYLSGMINSYPGFSRTYGFFEARMKMPPGAGMWPAFWLLPMDGSWPPEIDVLEWLGREPTTRYCGTHSGVGGPNVPQGGPYPIPDGAAAFHDYGVDWQRETISFTFDGATVASFPTPEDFHKPMYWILNLALGGGWAGPPNEHTVFPATLQVDWVKVYETSPYAPDSGGGGGESGGDGGNGGGDMTGTNHVINDPWSAIDLRGSFKPGDTVSLKFTYDFIEAIHGEGDTYVWAQQGTNITLAVVLPGRVNVLGVS